MREIFRSRQMGKKRTYSELSEAEKKALDEKLAAIPRPKLVVEIETGIFAPFVRLLSVGSFKALIHACTASMVALATAKLF